MNELWQLFENPDNKIALAYSGGKDSSVLLDLCEPFKERFTVVWVNTGFAFPHIREHVLSTTEGFNFQEIPHDLAPIWSRDGIPTHILPVDHAALVTAKAKRPFLQNWMACCSRRLETEVGVLERQGFNILLTGQRASDLASTTGFKQVMNFGGMSIIAPLFEWTEEDIKRYIEGRGIKLPMSASFADTSMECWHCPAQIERRIDFVKEHYPEFLPTIRENVRAVTETVRQRLDEMEKAGV